MTTMAQPETVRGGEYEVIRSGTVSADLWADTPSGVPSREPWQPADLPVPSGAQQYSRNVRAPGGMFVFVAVASIAGFGTVGDAGGRTSGMFTEAPTVAPAPPVRRRDEEEAAVASGRAALPTAAAQVEAVQDALSLSITQIADVIRVERATVHNWLRSASAVPRSRVASERLRRLHRVATAWRGLSSEDPRAFLAVPLGDDAPSLLDLLRADTWDDAAIDAALATLAGQLGGGTADQVERVGEPVGVHGGAVDATADDAEHRLAVEREQVRAAVSRARRLVG